MLAVVCALKCEAECLIQRFKLKMITQKTLFPIYCGDFVLIICGIGKLRAAAAVSYLYAYMKEPRFSAWFNVGIGGHASADVGEGFYAHVVTDQGNGKKFYPTFTWKEKKRTEQVITVDVVETHFCEQGVYEMEAAGFCSSALSCSTAELVHCYKVISDNLKEMPKKDPQLISSLIKSHLGKIETLLEYFHNALSELDRGCLIESQLLSFKERWHFTQTEQFMLKSAFIRWEALCPTRTLDIEQFKECKKAEEVLDSLNQILNVIPLCSP